MSVAAELYVASDDKEALNYATDPDKFPERAQYSSFTELELSTLWALIQDKEWDVAMLDDFPAVLVENGGESSIYRLPALLTSQLSQLAPGQISTAATKWAATEEMACTASDVQPIIADFASLAKKASASDRQLYFWTSV